MEAVVMREFGPPGVLRLGSWPEPVDRAGWVRVRLEASALNWHDVLVRQGVYRSPLPHVPGADGAGVRADSGEPVCILPSLFWGQRQSAPSSSWEILGDHRPGTYAEQVLVPEECVFPRPSGMSLHEAAAFPLVGLTTYRALFSRAGLRTGESVLVLGASGGIATTVVALATAIGASVVVTSSSEQKIQAARGLGAVDGVDHRHKEWVAGARSASPGGAGFDVVIDPVGRWDEALKALRPGGRCVVLGASAAPSITMDVRAFYFGQYDLLGSTMGSPRDMSALLAFMERERVRPPVIDSTFRLSEAQQAHERLESGQGVGKVVLIHH